jgi:hypothetical protein
MRHGSIVGTVLVIGGFALVACSSISGLDRLTFHGGAGGAGGGGATGSTSKSSTGGGQPTTSTAAGGGAGAPPSGPRIPCFDPDVKKCPAGDICCVDTQVTDGHCDECADPQGQCGADIAGCGDPTNYVRIACHTDADCAENGHVCCVLTVSGGQISGLACLPSCDASMMTFPVCDDDQACTTGTCVSVSYGSYGVCM